MKKTLSDIFKMNTTLLSSAALCTAMYSAQVSAEVTVIPKPAPLYGYGQEAGRSVAQHGDYSLMGSYKMYSGHSDGSGGAYLFKDGNPNYVKKFELGETVQITKSDGTVCEISKTDGATVGTRVAMSRDWIALDGNYIGKQRSNADYNGTCSGNSSDYFPTVFLHNRGDAHSELSHSVTMPSGEEIRGIAVDNSNLAVMTTDAVYTYTYSYSSKSWNHYGTLFKGSTFMDEDNQKAAIAMDNGRLLVGFPSHGYVFLFEKGSDNPWDILAASFGSEDRFGRAVDISGDHIIASSASSLSFLTIPESGTQLTLVDTHPYPATSVAISGLRAVAGIADVPSDRTRIYKFDLGQWEQTGAVEGVDDLPITDANMNPWSPDAVDIHGHTILAGWRGFNASSTEALVGALVHATIPNPFADLPVVDNAESTRVWINSGEFPWVRHSGSTPSTGTGPTSGAGGSRHYYYVETSYGGAYYAGDTAIFESESFDPENTELTFSYHMLGAHVGTLYIDLYLPGYGWIEDIWSREGATHASQSWQVGSYDFSSLSSITEEVKVRLRLVAGGGYLGDVAIDNIVLRNIN